ncbi:hypothetical protein DFH27DRAFT_615430 [Peziza echinospora]|nr:hypothetical protein DFH27DRAFT_615430 [Peziza echinospora]
MPRTSKQSLKPSGAMASRSNTRTQYILDQAPPQPAASIQPASPQQTRPEPAHPSDGEGSAASIGSTPQLVVLDAYYGWIAANLANIQASVANKNHVYDHERAFTKLRLLRQDLDDLERKLEARHGLPLRSVNEPKSLRKKPRPESERDVSGKRKAGDDSEDDGENDEDEDAHSPPPTKRRKSSHRSSGHTAVPSNRDDSDEDDDERPSGRLGDVSSPPARSGGASSFRSLAAAPQDSSKTEEPRGNKRSRASHGVGPGSSAEGTTPSVSKEDTEEAHRFQADIEAAENPESKDSQAAGERQPFTFTTGSTAQTPEIKVPGWPPAAPTKRRRFKPDDIPLDCRYKLSRLVQSVRQLWLEYRYSLDPTQFRPAREIEAAFDASWRRGVTERQFWCRRSVIYGRIWKLAVDLMQKAVASGQVNLQDLLSEGDDGPIRRNFEWQAVELVEAYGHDRWIHSINDLSKRMKQEDMEEAALEEEVEIMKRDTDNNNEPGQNDPEQHTNVGRINEETISAVASVLMPGQVHPRSAQQEIFAAQTPQAPIFDQGAPAKSPVPRSEMSQLQEKLNPPTNLHQPAITDESGPSVADLRQGPLPSSPAHAGIPLQQPQMSVPPPPQERRFNLPSIADILNPSPSNTPFGNQPLPAAFTPSPPYQRSRAGASSSRAPGWRQPTSFGSGHSTHVDSSASFHAPGVGRDGGRQVLPSIQPQQRSLSPHQSGKRPRPQDQQESEYGYSHWSPEPKRGRWEDNRGNMAQTDTSGQIPRGVVHQTGYCRADCSECMRGQRRE